MENNTFTSLIKDYSTYVKDNREELEKAPVLVKNGSEDQPNYSAWLLAMSMTPYAAGEIGKMGGVSDNAVGSEDLIQDSIIRLASKAKEFEAERGLKFNTFAGMQIFNVLESRKINASNGMKISKRRKENVAKLKKAFVELQQELGEEPTIEELAQHMGISEKAANDINNDRIAMYSSSLDAVIDNSDDMDDCLIDRIPTSDITRDEVEMPDFVKSVRNLINLLPDQERTAFLLCNKVNTDFSIIKEKFTKAEIARTMGVSASKVARLYDHAVELLQAEAKKRSMTESLIHDEYIA